MTRSSAACEQVYEGAEQEGIVEFVTTSLQSPDRSMPTQRVVKYDRTATGVSIVSENVLHPALIHMPSYPKTRQQTCAQSHIPKIKAQSMW